MSDRALLGTLLLGFALFFAVHVSIVVGLLRRMPRWRGLAALVVAPLAPYWAFRCKMYVRGVLWLISVIAYGVARALAR